ncbi:hypothetical protein [Deinococcus knuensis]|uniref:SAF domain-containing protein n=1 Tax=Deinococcus knuensis TaxID=1837380 RepID=A0ABQ2SMW2_9DEIO|nr:hypothetical protein [Deinococcus knuensis]GGS34627.1 hypothetical protein GCM10008961_27990 [Deinococcus knuensis]
MKARALLGLLLVPALLLPPGAQATTAPTLTLAQQAKKAEVIVRATLGQPADVQEGGVTYAAYPLTVTETLAGDPAGLPQREGVPTLYFLKGVADLPALRAGQDVIALLYTARLDSPLVGFNQGWYPVVNGAIVNGVPVSGEAAPAVTPPPPVTGSPAVTPEAAITDPAKLRAAILAAREARP